MLSPTTESVNTEIPSEIHNFQQLHSSNEQLVQESQQETQKLEVNQQNHQINDSSSVENKSPSQLQQSSANYITQPSISLSDPPSFQTPTSNQLIQASQQQPSTPSTQSLKPANIFSQSSSLFSKAAAPNQTPIPKPPVAAKKEIFKLIIPDVLKENFDKEGENKWRMANADITDYFNYGFCEASFKEYTNKVRTWRGSFPMDENYQLNKYNLDKLNDHIPMDYGGCSNPNDEGLLETPQDYNPFIKEQFINSAIEYLIDSFDMMRQKTDVMEIISNKNVLSKYVQKHDENIMENRQIQEMEKEQQSKFFDPLGSYSFSKNYAEYINQRPKAIDFIALQHQIMHNIEVKNQIIQPSDRGNKAANPSQGQQNTEKNKLQLQQLSKPGNTSNLPSEAPKPQMLLSAIPNNLMFGQRSGGMLPLQMQLFQQMQQQQYLAQMFKTQMGMNQQPYYQQFNRSNNTYTGNSIPGMFQPYGKSPMNNNSNNNFYNINNGFQQQTYQDNRESANKGLQSGNSSQNILHQSSRIGNTKYQYNSNTQQKNQQQQQGIDANEEETEYSKTRNTEKTKEIPKNNNSNKYKTKYDEDRERSRKHQRSDSSSRSRLSSREASVSSSGRKQKRKSKDNKKTDKRVKEDSYERKQSNKESRKYPKSQKDEDKYSKEQKNSNYVGKTKEFGESEKHKDYHRRDSFDKRDSRDNKEIRRNQRGQENEREKSDTGMIRVQEKESRTYKDREERQKDKSYSTKRTNEEIESKSNTSKISVSEQKIPQSSQQINSNAKTSAGGNGGISILQRIQKKSDTIPTPPPQINSVTSKQSSSTGTKLLIKTTETKSDQSKSYSKKSSKDISRERERERSIRKSRSPSQSRHRHHHHSHKDRSSQPQKRSKSPQKQYVNKKTRKDSLSSSPSKSNSNIRDRDLPTKTQENKLPKYSNTGTKAKEEPAQQKKQDDNLTIKREKSGSSNGGTSQDDHKQETHPKFFSQYFNALKKSEEDISNHSRKSSSLSDSLERSYSPPRQTKRNKKD